MIRGDDQFGLGSVQVAAGVGDESIGHLATNAWQELLIITQNNMKGFTGARPGLIKCFQYRVGRLKIVNAVGQAQAAKFGLNHARTIIGDNFTAILPQVI